MSRKRKQSKRAVAPKTVEAVETVESEAVPEEILAEGSGPVGKIDAAELAEAANAVGRRRKKRRTPEQKPKISTELASSGQSGDVSADGEDGTSNGADPGEVLESAASGADTSDEDTSDAAISDAAVFEADTSDAASDLDAAASSDDDAAEVSDAAASDDDVAAASDDDASGDLAGAAAGSAEAGLRAVEDADVEAVSGADAAELDAVVDPDAGLADDPDLGEAVVCDDASAEALATEGSLAADAGEAAAGDDDAAEPGAVLPTSAASMDAAQLKHLVEALVFASDKPLTIARLRQLTRVSDTKRLEQALADVAEDFRDRGVVLQQVSGGYQFRTRTQFSAWVQQLIAGRPVRLSRAQLETLAIIAYRQPITRPEIDEIRGVDSSATLKLLIDRELIRILGKKEEVGRPMLYGTTKEFLDFFSLGDLRELPTLREYSELTDESRQVMSARLGLDLDDTARAGDDAADDDGGEGGGSGGDGGSSGFGPGDGVDPGDAPAGNGVDIGASARAHGVAVDSELIFDDAATSDAFADVSEQAAPDQDAVPHEGAEHEGAEIQAAPADEGAESNEELSGEPHVEATEHEGAEVQATAADDAESNEAASGEPHVEATEHEGAEVQATTADDAESGESHVEATEHEGAEVQAASADEGETGKSHVEAPELVGAEVQAAAADEVMSGEPDEAMSGEPDEAVSSESHEEATEHGDAEVRAAPAEAAESAGSHEEATEHGDAEVRAAPERDGESHVGATEHEDAGVSEGDPASSADNLAADAVVGGAEWPEGSGRIGEPSEPWIEPAALPVDGDGQAADVVAAEQRAAQPSLEPTSE